MFTVEELNAVIQQPEFVADYNWVQYTLVYKQNKQSILFQDSILNRLDYFLEAVMASFPTWTNKSNSSQICKIGAEISEALSFNDSEDAIALKKYRLKASILYESAGLPALSQAAIMNNEYNSLIESFFKRKAGFHKLGGNNKNGSNEFDVKTTNNDLSDAFLEQNADDLLKYEQGSAIKNDHFSWAINLAKNFSFELNSSELNALKSITNNRYELATISNVSETLFEKLKSIDFPSELWPAQVQAIRGGLLNDQFDSFGLASPTGTGKTFLTRLLITDVLQENPDSKMLYIVPSRALVYEVATSLENALSSLDIQVLAVNPQLTNLDGEEEDLYENANIVVLTPEKADLLVRLGQSTLQEITHVIVDEAHHIEAETRGVLLELYLWRLKKMTKDRVRFIFLSAVAPNIHDLTNWVGRNPKSEIVEQRATRMRSGVYKIIKNNTTNLNEGWIYYSDGLKLKVAERVKASSSQRQKLTQAVKAIHQEGPVLIVAKGKKECENLAKDMLKMLQDGNEVSSLTNENLNSDYYKRLDSRLEREMYPSVLMRELVRHKIAYHHAGLPPRVRISLEDAIRNGLIDYVFATTTLAEGVNFPFSSVLVQSLALKEAPQAGIAPRYRPITPRTFWNIAGRAGRPGFDKEGQVVLFEPSLGLEKINYVMDSYLNPNLKDIEPVKSALSNSLSELYDSVESSNFDVKRLENIELDDEIPRNIKGTINLLRVGLVHAQAANLLSEGEDILESTFANSFLKDDVKEFAKQVITSQNQVLKNFFIGRLAPSRKIVAEMGLSIDTLERLKNYVINLEDWQIANFAKLFYGGEVNLNNVGYVIGPVAKHIAELEGNKLGGYLSELIVKWLSGIPFISIKSQLTSDLKNQSLEQLIHVIYSRIQFLLPWGLYAVDSIVEEEAKSRNINYNNELKSLSYLTDAGVPSFDAHRLVGFNFERVDSTRLYRLYKQKGGLRLGVDITSWVMNENEETLITALRGPDNRRLDYDFFEVIKAIKNKMG